MKGAVAVRAAAPTAHATRRRRAAALLLAGSIALAGTLLLWRPLLRGVGAALVAQDELAAADVLVVSASGAPGDALEAAALYRDGYAPRLLIPGTTIDDRGDDLRALGVPYLSSSELIRSILERSGVPRAAIEIGAARYDGTATEAVAIADGVAARPAPRVMVIATRTHTARLRWLLRRQLPEATQLIVRSPRDDTYDPQLWWTSRAQARETAMEYLRWLNVALGDLWN